MIALALMAAVHMSEADAHRAFDAYRRQAEPIARELGNARAIDLCKIRPPSWFDKVSSRLDGRLRDLKRSLSRNDIAFAYRFDREIEQSQLRFTLQEPINDSCDLLRSLPFAHSDTAFRP
jgi:hypothetical protein